MKKDLLQAAILKLQGSVLEVFETLKDKYASPATDGTVDEIASLAIRLASLEGGLITLQQYSNQIMETAEREAMETALAAARQALAEAKSVAESPSAEVTGENSKTMKKVLDLQAQQDPVGNLDEEAEE
tara:strand:- start:10550 stop:10936 length:387 start_codon:yes stop_codon:yes gene_type:complete